MPDQIRLIGVGWSGMVTFELRGSAACGAMCVLCRDDLREGASRTPGAWWPGDTTCAKLKRTVQVDSLADVAFGCACLDGLFMSRTAGHHNSTTTYTFPTFVVCLAPPSNPATISQSLRRVVQVNGHIVVPSLTVLSALMLNRLTSLDFSTRRRSWCEK